MKYYLEILKGPGRGHRLSLFEGEAFLGGKEGGHWVLQSAPPEDTHFKLNFVDDQLTLTAYQQEGTFWHNDETVHEAILEADQIVKFDDCILQYCSEESAAGIIRYGRLSALQLSSIIGISLLILMQFLVMVTFSWSWRAKDELAALKIAEDLEASLAPAITETNAVDDMSAELELLAQMEVPEDMKSETEDPKEDIDPEELTADRAERMLDDGVKLWRERQLAEAERQFKRILQMDPSYVPAMVEIAKLHQFRGQSKEALVYWERVIQQGRDSEFYFKAVSEKSRIEQEEKRNSFARGLTKDKKSTPKPPTAAESKALANKFDKYKPKTSSKKAAESKKTSESEVKKASAPAKKPEPKKTPVVLKKKTPPPVKKPAPKPKVKPPSRPVLVIESTDVQRYLKNERFDEMRLLTVVLQSKALKGKLAGKDFDVKVTFYDKNNANGSVEKTQVLVPDPSVKLEGRILPEDSPTVSFAYVVQKGYRGVQKKKTKKSMTYYGYLVEIFYRGQLIDRVAVPKSLAK